MGGAAEQPLESSEAEAAKAKEKAEDNLKKFKEELNTYKNRLKKKEQLFNEEVARLELHKKNIKTNYYESLDKLIKIDNIDEFINDQDYNTNLNSYLKYFDLIELFLITTCEDFTITSGYIRADNPNEDYFKKKSIKITGIEGEAEREAESKITTHLKNIYKIITNHPATGDQAVAEWSKFKREFESGLEEMNSNKLKISAKIDTVSQKIELTNLKLYDYEILNSNIRQQNKISTGYAPDDTKKIELVDLNCIHLLQVDLW